MARFDAVFGDGEQVGQHGLGDGDAGGAAQVGGEVGDAEVGHAVVDESGLGQGGGAAGFDAAALVDGDVDDGGARLHALHHGAGDDVGRAGAGHEHRADHHVGGGHGFGDGVVVGQAGFDSRARAP